MYTTVVERNNRDIKHKFEIHKRQNINVVVR